MNHAKLKKEKGSRMYLLFIILYSLLTDGIVNGII